MVWSMHRNVFLCIVWIRVIYNKGSADPWTARFWSTEYFNTTVTNVCHNIVSKINFVECIRFFLGTEIAQESILSIDSRFKCCTCALLASFPGCRRNGLATTASSNCIRMWCHGNCNISFQQSSTRDTYNFSSYENGGFPARRSNCLLSVLLLKWNRSHSNKDRRAKRLH